MPLFTRHPTTLQTAYSELKRRALEQLTVLAGTPGSVGVRTVTGRSFYYRQFYDALGKKRAEYIGARGAAKAEARAASVREAVELASALVKEARALARDGYVRVDARAAAVLAALANRGVFRGGAVLVGSHAHGALMNELGVRGPAFRTEDVDVGRGRPLTLALGPEESFETWPNPSCRFCRFPRSGATSRRPPSRRAAPMPSGSTCSRRPEAWT